jgi:hypothetical protein
MRHEILRDAVVGVIKKDFQFVGPDRQSDACDFLSAIIRLGEQDELDPLSKWGVPCPLA